MRPWRSAARERLRALDWGRLVDDVRPFLERRYDIDLMSEDNVTRLLGHWRN